MLQGGISQQEWRVSELLYRLLDLLRPYLNHPYQSVRDRLGSVLTNIFMHDVALPNSERSWSPRVDDFVREILPQLAPLLENGAQDSPVHAIERFRSAVLALVLTRILSSSRWTKRRRK